MLGALVLAAALLPTPAQLPPIPRLVQAAAPVFCGTAATRSAAITFDDGPGPYTLPLGSALRRAHVRATFFDVGNRIAVWPAAVRAQARIGEVGDHTWSHAHLTELPAARAARELTTTETAIEAVTRRAPVLFRPAYEESDRTIELLARRFGLLDVRWSVDSGDSRVGATPRMAIRAAVAGLRPGAIVLLHDLHPWDARVAAAVSRAARSRGLRLVTVSQLLGRRFPPPRAACR